MRNRGSKFEYEKERTDDLMRAYRQLIDSSKEVRLSKIYEDVVNMPSARFWVSEERAAIIICSMMRGDKLEKMRPTRREMFYEIYKRAMELRKRFPELPILQIAFKVVRQPAPKFYIRPDHAKFLIFSVKKEWFEERKKKLRFLF